MIAALFVQTNGSYFRLDGVDPWDEKRDARLYAGPHPVVAHPPCSRWCLLAGLVEARWGHKRGDDGGCFSAALNAVRNFGGVLEHPAYSAAFAAFCLPAPPTGAGSATSSADGPATSSKADTGTPRRKQRGSTQSGANSHRFDSVSCATARARLSCRGAETTWRAVSVGLASGSQRHRKHQPSFATC